MNLVITGISNFFNRGTEALALVTIDQLRQRLDNPTFTVLSKIPKSDAYRTNPDYTTHHVDPYQTQVMRGLRRFGLVHTPVGDWISPAFKRARQAIRRADAVIATGGDVFGSDYSGPARWLEPLAYGLKCGKLVMFIGESIGPFRNDAHKQLFVNVARRSRLLTIREQPSYDYCINDLGLSPDIVKRTADVSFLVDPPTGPDVDRMLAYYGYDANRGTVVVSISEAIPYIRKIDPSAHFKRWTEFLDYLLRDEQRQVIMVPHSTEAPDLNADDCRIATKMLRHFDYHPRLLAINGDHTMPEFKAVINKADVAICERGHAAMGGLSCGVCTITVGFSVKGMGIAGDVLGGDPREAGLLIPAEDFVQTEQIYELFEKAWANREEIRRRFAERLPEVKQRAKLNYDLAAEVLSR